MKNLIVIFVCLFVILSAGSCHRSPNLTGKWQEINKIATFEFADDYTFKAVDNMGMTVAGRYYLSSNGKVRFEIKHSDSAIEIIQADITVANDELTFIYNDTGEVEKYRRVKP